ncbi:MAG: hypothetical protein K6F84_08590 [Lachnospiraceae bacterium]|nr:hypothetical protein [Lachnospiraceae bacterium]
MAINSIDMAVNAKTMDYTAIRHHEENHVLVEQENMAINQKKDEHKKANQVSDADKTDWLNKKFDAKEKGSNSYNPKDGKKQKKDKDGEDGNDDHHKSFDIRI